MRDQDEVDLTLDAALSSYGDPGPVSGLEQRILAHITKTRVFDVSSHRRWLLWLLAVPSVACLLLCAVVLKTSRQESHQRTQSQPPEQPLLTGRVAQPAPVHSKPARRISVPALAARHHSADRPSSLPKLDVFPTPRPLTHQEQALLVAVARTPQSQRETLVEKQKSGDAPLSIAAINIPPLESPEEGKN